MTDRDALLAAITANPDEDTPRLIYADWLEEHDEAERAEFIRLQCRLEHLSRKSAEGKPLAKREKELQAKLFEGWYNLDYTSVSFRRGFVGTITSNLHVLPYRFTDLLSIEDAPAYELKVAPDDDDALYDDDITEEVFSDEGLRRCVSLDLPCMGMGPSGIICDSEHLINLRRFNFPDNEAGPTIESIASPTFANLRWANFRNSDSAADNPSIIPLAESPHLANLEYLDFGECEQWSDGASAIAMAAQWTRLRYLDLCISDFSLGSVTQLFNTQHLPALAELNLSQTFGEGLDHGAVGTGDPFAAMIATSPLFARLSKLWLQGNGITDDGARALAASTRKVKLTLLNLSENDISDESKRALVERFGQGVCIFERAESDD
jgi:uncharacterized protein (TIGR02996 family)